MVELELIPTWALNVTVGSALPTATKANATAMIVIFISIIRRRTGESTHDGVGLSDSRVSRGEPRLVSQK